MPLYFFNVNGEALSGDAGVMLDGIKEAKCEAVKIAGQLVCDAALSFWNTKEWNMVVTDETGLHLISLLLIGMESPAIMAE